MQQIFLKVTALILLIWSLMQSVFSASLPESEEETWEESQPWLRSHNEPHHQRQRHGWFWRKKPRTTPSITEQPPPATTTKPPGPEICRNRTIVTRVQDEPGPIVCLRKNITELMTQLKSVDGFIRRYTAIRVIDACGFQDLTPFKSSIPTRPPTMAGNSSKQLSNSKGKRQADQIQSDIELQRRKRSIPTSPGTLLRGCQGRGTIIDGTSEHRLCTECAATTRLPNDRFPRYINEVICRDSDMQCAAKMGMCFQRSLKLSFLRSTGMFQFDALLSAVAGKTVYKEIWEEYTQEIRSCCECGMYSAIYNKIATSDD